MTPWLEVILPVRNPGTKLAESVDSLLSQTDHNFGAVLSDNHSSSGLEHLVEAERRLAANGIPVRWVRPALELTRVQHWNWAHAQAEAAWLKPLFVGDVLFPRYVELLRRRVQERPQAALIRCEFEIRQPDGSGLSGCAPFASRSLTPQEFLTWFPRHGNWLGGPVNMAYSQFGWRAAGGYAVHLPACADLNLYVTLALHFGLETIPEPLAAFQLHDQRFSHGIAKRRVNGCFEIWLILRQARNYCQTAGLVWPEGGVFRGVAGQMKTDYWYPAKKRLKQLLSPR